MALLKLSKFKLQLHALVTEVRDLRVRIPIPNLAIAISFQKQKQTEEECNRKIQELQTELASLQEERQKLDWKVNYLLNDNALLESKQKELKGTIDGLLQSRDNFMHVYEESTYEMRRSLEIKDRKLNVLSEKLNSHLLLFDSIEKEAFSIKQIMDKVQSLVSEKEELGKNISNFCLNPPHLQKTLSIKDVEMENLISDNEALHYEVGSLRLILQRIQDTVTNMNEEDKSLFSSILQYREACPRDINVEDNRMEDMVQNNEEKAQELIGSPI
ncbi:hypothetical protein L6164_020701 [Bauhinia variegata]|uniref:Uncharacterized protein n=1 Tax=Bauhinia variegata TaxID=167791 RepID=A0ACB9MW70_BAUVA|nr:hypothetical protein L6164_020701 [Bauhinia variegata]